ncbi:MAG: cytochrome c [Archangium sp.]
MRRILLGMCVTLAACDGGFRVPGPTGGGGGGTAVGGPGPLGGGGGGFGGGFAVDGGGSGTFFCSSSDEQGVTEIGSAPKAISGGTMVALQSGALVVGDPDRERVWLISPNFLIARGLALEAGDEPGRVVEGPNGFAYLTLRRGHELVEVNVTAGTLRRLPTCALPRGLAWRATDSKLIVGCLDGRLESLDPSTGTRQSIATLPLTDLRDVVIDGARLLVTTFRSAKLFAVADDGTVTTLTETPVDGFAPRVAWRALSRPGGGASIVRQQHRTTTLPDANNCSAYGGFATGSRTTGGGSGFSQPSSNIVTSEVLNVSGTSTIRTSLSESFNAVVLPVDVAVSPSGRVAVLSAGRGMLTQLEAGFRRDVSIAPHDLDTQLTSVVFVGEDALVFQREPAKVWRVGVDGAVTPVVELVGARSVSTGHELFHRATPANIACASCHPEAGDDAHTWNFPEGPRRTPSLRGGIGGTAPFHWTGDMENINALMANVMSVRMRGPKLTLEGTQSVEDWLHIQPSLPPPEVDSEAVARGTQVFTTAGCAGCHVGAQGTNNQTMDVGTGLPLQVPRLTELAWRGPWMHDGRMQRLEDRFQPSAGGDFHGLTSMLTPEQKTDLLEYLKTR